VKKIKIFDRLFYFLSMAIVILIVIVITIKHYDQKNEMTVKRFQFIHSPVAINSLITQSTCVYLDLLPHFKRMLKRYFSRTSTS